MTDRIRSAKGRSNIFSFLTAKRLIVGYLLVFLSTLVIDQATKWHAQKNFLVSSHATELRGYRSSSVPVLCLGRSPACVRERQIAEMSSNNWLDLRLTYVRNPGAAWGTWAKMPQRFRLAIFYAMTLFVSVVVMLVFRASHPGCRILRTGLVLVLGGALGNLIDRLTLNYVIDWLHLHWRLLGWEYSFPVFNWADAAISIGLILWVGEGVLVDLLARKRVKALT